MSDPLKDIADLPLPGSETTWQFSSHDSYFDVLRNSKVNYREMEEAVLRTEEAWDMPSQCSRVRAYGLYFIGSINLALIWVYGRGRCRLKYR